MRAALESTHPLQVELVTGETASHLGPLIGMHSAVWIPLRARGRTFGLAMAAFARPPGDLDLEAWRARADEVTLALQHHRNIRRHELASEELRAQMQISQAILCDVSADSILPEIARSARQYVQAEFIALGRGSTLPLAAEGWVGEPGYHSAVHEESLMRLWRSTFEEGRQAEISGESLENPSSSVAEFPHSVLDRVVALPIEVRNGTRGVLMAGLLRSEDSDEDLAKLASYALLAASALDREAAREERMAYHESLKKIVEGSGECLLAIDGEGNILEASRAAALLSSAPRGRTGGAVLEELFLAEARAAVIEWRYGLPSSANASAQMQLGLPPVALEAALVRGGVVRMHLRQTIPGGGNGTRWLIHLENLGTQEASRETEERLKSEMGALLESIDSGVLVLDADGQILLASERLGAIFGIESRRLLEFRNIDALIDSLTYHFLRPLETAARWREHVRQSSEASWDEFEFVRTSRKIVERFARPLYKPDGTRLGWLEVYRDMTGQRLIQSKLLQTEKMAALGQLVSGIAHELNNP